MIFAAGFGHELVAQALLDFSCLVDVQTNTGDTPLMIASTAGHAPIAQLFLSRDASVTLIPNQGLTAMICAAANEFEKIVDLLMDRGSYIDAQTLTNETVMFASVNGHEAVVGVLLGRDASTDLRKANQ